MCEEKHYLIYYEAQNAISRTGYYFELNWSTFAYMRFFYNMIFDIRYSFFLKYKDEQILYNFSETIWLKNEPASVSWSTGMWCNCYPIFPLSSVFVYLLVIPWLSFTFILAFPYFISALKCLFSTWPNHVKLWFFINLILSFSSKIDFIAEFIMNNCRSIIVSTTSTLHKLFICWKKVYKKRNEQGFINR